MSDKELLELAAKAAGYRIDDDFDRLDVRQASGAPTPWRPLDDDGDALRLAVKLGIEFYMEGSGGSECVWANEIFEWTDGDALSSTRRAIVRAAATIGGMLP